MEDLLSNMNDSQLERITEHPRFDYEIFGLPFQCSNKNELVNQLGKVDINLYVVCSVLN